MREAAIPGYRLSNARFSTRVLITLALVGVLLGLFFAGVLALYKTGVAPDVVRVYFLGAPASDPLDKLLSAQPRPLAELAEVTHLHLMGGSLLLFLLCHLLTLCDVDDRTRTVMYVAAFSSFITGFGSPWLIILVHPAFSYVYGPAMVLFMVMILLCAAIPLKEMWLGSRK